MTAANVGTMWGKSRQSEPKAEEVLPPRLKPAVRQARIEAAERTGIVVDLRDAELARLEILNEALDPVFAEISPEIELFDRGISRGEVPRLWVDAVAHVAMGHDKRVYRFVQDTSFGRKVLAESNDVDSIVEAVTQYVARRLVERERALAADPRPAVQELLRDVRAQRRRWRWKAIKAFVFGLIAGVVALFFIAWLLAPPPQ